jgi:hypothetical protein
MNPGRELEEARMQEAAGKKTSYAAWQKAVLIGCLLVAVIGTLGVLGAMVKLAGTIGDYGGSVGAPFVIGFMLMLFSFWLFAGSGALLVYIAKVSGDIKAMVEAKAGQ